MPYQKPFMKRAKGENKDNEMEGILYQKRPVWKYHIKMQSLQAMTERGEKSKVPSSSLPVSGS
jgi:hypothetical protein